MEEHAEASTATAAHEGCIHAPPVLFLDIDGVLNVRTWSGRDFTELQPHLLKNLRRVLRTTGARIVLSSTWRLDGDLMDELRRAMAEIDIDAAVIIGETPDLREPGTTSFSVRAREIVAWLEKDGHGMHRRWAVVDDQDVPGSNPAGGPAVAEHFVQTDDKVGLDEEAADRVQNLLLDL